MTAPKPGNVHTQVSVVVVVPHELYEVVLNFTFPDGTQQAVSKGLRESVELATKLALEVQEYLCSKGGTPTGGIS